MATKRKPVDWEAVEREYRAGQLSVHEVGRQYGVSHTAINKRAKAHGWTRNLIDRVRQGIAARMVSGEVSEANAKVSVETAVERGITVLNLHRSDVARLRRIGARLAERLEATIEGREVDGPCIGDKESVSDMLEKLSRVSTRTIQLERQAFNLDDDGTGKPTEIQRIERVIVDPANSDSAGLPPAS